MSSLHKGDTVILSPAGRKVWPNHCDRAGVVAFEPTKKTLTRVRWDGCKAPVSVCNHLIEKVHHE